MTVAKRLRTSKATLEGLLSDFRMAALEVEDEHLREMFSGFSQSLESVLQAVNDRLQAIELEEPQYKE